MREQYERQLNESQEAYGKAMLGLSAPKKIAVPAGEGQALMASFQKELREDGIEVPKVKLCHWFVVARRTMYNKPHKVPLKLQGQFVAPLTAPIEQEPSCGYRTLASQLGLNKNTV